MADGVFVTRAVKFTLDPSRSEERLLRSYCGASRFAYNWAVAQVKTNRGVRAAERAAGAGEADLTPPLSWSAFSLNKAWNATKADVAPWWRDVSMHAFRSGTTAAAAAFDNFSDSRKGVPDGRPVRFPRFKKRDKATLSVSFVELNHQLSWLHPGRHHVRLMLPQSPGDPDLRRRRGLLGWIHTVESTRRLYRLVETGRATIQKVTISFRGGRWQVAFQVRHTTAPTVRPARRRGGLIAADAGVAHLATLSTPVAGLTDQAGHVANPRVLGGELRRLAKLDRGVARSVKGSKNRARLLHRRARLHGRVTQTRALRLHAVSNVLAGGFDTVAVEDLNVAGMSNRKRHLGRSLADVALGELRRQLAHKAVDHGHTLVVVDRFYPSSKTCSDCGAVKAKLPLDVRTFTCTTCSAVLDRDVNAARNIAREAARLLEQQHHPQEHVHGVAGFRPETGNADPRPRKTSPAHAEMAVVA